MYSEHSNHINHLFIYEGIIIHDRVIQYRGIGITCFVGVFFSQEANVTLKGFKLTSDTQSTDDALHMYLNMIN